MDRDQARCIIKQPREVDRDAWIFGESEIVCRTHHLTLFISNPKTPDGVAKVVENGNVDVAEKHLRNALVKTP